MCATAHIHCECTDGSVTCQLWTAKARVAPLRKLTIPKLELQAAVLGTRLCKSVMKNSIWEFSEVHRIVDSECTLLTLKKDTLKLPEFQSNRVGECMESSDISEWFHTRSKNNIADLGTRNEATVQSISEESEWQRGKQWMYLPVDQWPVTQDIQNSHNVSCCIGEDVVEITAVATAAEPPVFDFEAMKKQTYQFVIKLVAIVFKMGRSKWI